MGFHLNSTLKYIKAAGKGVSFVRSLLLDRRPALAYVGGWLGKQNLGDEALLLGYERLFSNHKFLHFDGGRASSLICRLMPSLIGGVLGGGTLIGQKRRLLEIASSYHAGHGNLVVFGSGVEDPGFWPGETTVADWKPLLEQCRYIGVRGPLSAEVMRNSGIENVEVVGDPVIAFAMEKIESAPRPNTLGINIGVSDGRLWGSEERVCMETAKLAKLAKMAGWEVEWFVVWPKDMEITRRAAELSCTSGKIHHIFEDHEAYIRKARSLSVFAGMKLHATVLATCALTPSVMLAYRTKCSDFMRSIGQEDFTFRTDTFQAGELWEILREWNANRDRASRALLNAIQPLQVHQHARAREIESQYFQPNSH
jgi:hypothetical protein